MLSPVADDAAEDEEDTPGRGSVSGPPHVSEGVPPAVGERVERGSRLDEPSAPPPWLQNGADADVMTKVIIKEGSETSFGMGINPDLLIGDVKVDGAAARAGVCDGMQIVSVMGERVTERQRVLVILKSLPPKAPLTIELRRIGSQQKPQQPQPAAGVASQLVDAREALRLHLESMEVKAAELAELKQRRAALQAGATKRPTSLHFRDHENDI